MNPFAPVQEIGEPSRGSKPALSKLFNIIESKTNMPRPESVTNEDILRWSEKIDNDLQLDTNLAQNPIIREVCYAGQWLVDRLVELECPDILIGRILYTGGMLSFGRKDPWIIHRDLLSQYVDGTLEYEEEPKENQN